MDWLTAGTGLALGLAMVMLTTFFATKDARYDRVAEWSFVVFGALGVRTVVLVSGQLGIEGLPGAALAGVGILGAAVLGVGELAITLRLVDFKRLTAPLSTGFVAFLAWVGGASLVGLVGGRLPPELAWLGIVSIAATLGILATVLATPGVMSGSRDPATAQMVAFVLPLAGIVAWLAWLGVAVA
jgi:hypothetical protein